MTELTIGMFTSVYYPVKNGVVNSIGSFTQGLRELGHEVYVFAPSHPGYKDEDKYVIRVPSVPLGHDYRWPIRSPYSVARDIVEKLDLVHIQHPLTMGTHGRKVAKKRGIPLFFTAHTQYQNYVHYIPLVPPAVSRWYMRRLLIGLAEECSMIFAPGDANRDMLRGYGIEKRIEILPNGVDVDRFKTGKGEGVREKLGVSKSDVLAVYVGRIEKEKNLEALIRAVGQAQQDVGLKVMFIGGGSEMEHLKQYAAEQHADIVFAGPVDYNEMPNYLDACDMFITASMSEVHPLTVIEALAAGLPVVAYDGPGIHQIVTRDKDGILCKPHDEKALAANIIKATNQTRLRKTLGKAAVKNAKRFSVQATSKYLLGFYEEYLK